MSNLSSDEVSNVFKRVFGPGISLTDDSGLRHCIAGTQISISTIVVCDIRVLVEKIGDKWMFPSSFFVPKKETTQQAASRILLDVTGENLDPKKWIPIDIRSHPDRIDMKSKGFSVDIGYAALLEAKDIPLVDTNRFFWALVDFDNPRFPLPLLEDHDQFWESAFNVFDILLKS